MSTSAIDKVVRNSPVNGFVRAVVAVSVGVVITILLYWLMSALVAAGKNALTQAPAGRIVDFVRVPDPPQLRTPVLSRPWAPPHARAGAEQRALLC